MFLMSGLNSLSWVKCSSHSVWDQNTVLLWTTLVSLCCLSSTVTSDSGHWTLTSSFVSSVRGKDMVQARMRIINRKCARLAEEANLSYERKTSSSSLTYMRSFIQKRQEVNERACLCFGWWLWRGWHSKNHTRSWVSHHWQGKTRKHVQVRNDWA